MVLISQGVPPRAGEVMYGSHEPLIKSEKENYNAVLTEKAGCTMHGAYPRCAWQSPSNASVTEALGRWATQGAAAFAACLLPCAMPRRPRGARPIGQAPDLANAARRDQAPASAQAPAVPGGAGQEEGLGHHKKRYSRDWTCYPALVDLPTPPGDVYAVSDVHADPERLVCLLAAHGLVTVGDDNTVLWCGGDAILVVLGDFINKGPSSLGCIDLLRSLETQAAKAGGAVVTLAGNHEAEFLADPHNEKAERDHGINGEIRASGDTPKHFLRDDNPRGHWLLTRPFGARIGRWFFAHGGNSKGYTFAKLQRYLQEGVDEEGFGTSALLGRNSILQARGWYDDSAATGAKFSAALGTQHIVFGHDPSALGPKGSIAMGQEGTLFRIDCGLSREVDFSRGNLLRIRREDNKEAVHACHPTGDTTLLLTRGLTAP